MKKLILFTLFIIAANLFAQSKYSEAVNAINNKKYDEAIKIARNDLDIDSTETALKILLNLNDALPNDQRVMELIGDAYKKMSVPDNALNYYTKAESLDSMNTSLKFKIAQLLYKDKRYTDAANKYLKIIAIDPQNADAYYQLGTLLYYAKEYANAAFYLKKYLGFDKKIDAFVNGAQAYYNINDFKNADSLAEAGLNSFPNNLKLTKITADSKLALNDVENAIKIYNSLPDSIINVSDLNRIARSLDSIQKDSLAAIFINKSLSKDSTQSDLYLLAGNINLTGKNYDKAAYFYAKRLKIDSTSVSTMTNLGLAYIELKNYPAAKAQFANAINHKNDFVPAYVWYARTERLTDSLNSSLKIYEKLIDATKGKEDNYKNELSESYAFLGYGDLLHKKYPSAIDNLKNAVNYLPSSAQYHVWLGEAYALNGDKAKASVEYKNALKIQPEDPDAKKGLKLLEQAAQ